MKPHEGRSAVNQRALINGRPGIAWSSDGSGYTCYLDGEVTADGKLRSDEYHPAQVTLLGHQGVLSWDALLLPKVLLTLISHAGYEHVVGTLYDVANQTDAAHPWQIEAAQALCEHDCEDGTARCAELVRQEAPHALLLLALRFTWQSVAAELERLRPFATAPRAITATAPRAITDAAQSGDITDAFVVHVERENTEKLERMEEP